MRNASGQPNHHAGSVGVFTIKATGVSVKMCEQSWSFDKAEGEASLLREASGLAAVVTAKSNMALRVAADACATFFLREHGYTRQFDRYDEGNYLAYLWGEPAEGRVAIYGACCSLFGSKKRPSRGAGSTRIHRLIQNAIWLLLLRESFVSKIILTDFA
jgi:hypothetical protein